MDINQILELNYYDYKSLYDNDKVIKSIKLTNYDLNVIIGVKKRKEYLKTTVNYFKEAIKNSRLKIAITIVEQDDIPEDFDDYKNEDINYIFLPLNLLNTDNQYSRALSFNVGYYFTERCKYYLFHDCDLLVPNNFFKILEKYYLNSSFEWIQSFTKKRLSYLNEDTTKEVMNKIIDLNSLNINEHFFIPERTGAAGGSTLVKREIFEEVGGFDPELFFGYAPEDSVFMTKLCCLKKQLNFISSCHQAHPSNYADNPPIELYHQHHPTMEFSNPYLMVMRQVNDMFWGYPYSSKMHYVNAKKEIMRKENLKFNK